MYQYAFLDSRLRKELSALTKGESRDDKIAMKLEEGRIYGLRQMYYDMKLKRDLGRQLHGTSITEEHW
jgi:hypothetical protein